MSSHRPSVVILDTSTSLAEPIGSRRRIDRGRSFAAILLGRQGGAP
jgi:hypothetical protein